MLGSLIVAAKCGDTGAYTFGRLFGRRKMSPLLSPGKTWAGAVGAVVVGGLGAWAWLQYAPRLFGGSWTGGDWLVCVLYGVIVAIAGLVGDLCESLIKRDLGKKDAAAHARVRRPDRSDRQRCLRRADCLRALADAAAGQLDSRNCGRGVTVGAHGALAIRLSEPCGPH